MHGQAMCWRSSEVVGPDGGRLLLVNLVTPKSLAVALHRQDSECIVHTLKRVSVYGVS